MRPSIDKYYDINIDVDIINEKFDKLCKIWWDDETCKINDSEGKRLTTHFIRKCPKHPILLSILADDVNSFKKHKIDEENYSELDYFEFSCLCDSLEIIKSFEKEAYLHCLNISKYAIGYLLCINQNSAFELFKDKITLCDNKALGCMFCSVMKRSLFKIRINKFLGGLYNEK